MDAPLPPLDRQRLARTLRQHLSATGYVAIRDRTDRHRSRPVARLNLDPTDPAFATLGGAEDPAGAVLRWVRRVRGTHRHRRLRVRLHQPKGAPLASVTLAGGIP